MEKNKLNVLLADDERLARETMRDYLPWEQLGMEIPICVENGELALDYLCTHPVDIFIMDIRMPVMDGMKLLEEIGRRNLDILIIVLSAYDQFEYAQKAIQSRRVFEYVLKPIKRKDFCGILEKAASEISGARGLHKQEDLVSRLGRLRQEFMACACHHQLDDALVLSGRELETKLADEMQMNANYLSSQFKREMGTGFVEYISILRIRMAQQLLKDMRYRTNEVASLVGFDNPKYFSRVFKKMTGILPSEYRSRIREYANIGNEAADCKDSDSG